MKRLPARSLVGPAAALLLALASPAFAAEDSPYRKADESWISITGVVLETSERSFVLDYGEGLVEVEMDGWLQYPKDFEVIEGDPVTVYGRIDDDFYEATTIEAGRVYDKKRDTHFYASTSDEELADEGNLWMGEEPLEPGKVTVRGTVSGIDGRRFTIDTGLTKLTVDTSGMPYDPLDERQGSPVGKGDVVSVSGRAGKDLVEKRTLRADSVVLLETD
jgi:hypothetical protein